MPIDTGGPPRHVLPHSGMNRNLPSHRPARRPAWWLAIALIVTAGCVQVDQDLVLSGDGSGTLTMGYTVERETLEALSRPVGGPRPPLVTEADIRRDLAVYAPYGIQTLGTQVLESASNLTVKIRLGFDDIRTLAHTPFFADNKLRLTRRDEGHWMLEQQLATPDAQALGPGLQPPDHEPNEGFPEGFRAVFAVTAPGAIVASNADRVEGRTARWTLGEEGKAESIRFARGTPMRLVFSGEGLALAEPRRERIRLPAPD